MKQEAFQEMVEGSSAEKGKRGSRNSMPTPGGSVTHPTKAIKVELSRQVVFSFPQQNTGREEWLTEPQETPFLGTFFHKAIGQLPSI